MNQDNPALFGKTRFLERQIDEFLLQHGGSRDSDATRRDVKELVAVVVRSVRAAVRAARSFFRDPAAVGDHVNEIRIFEAEADAIALRLKRSIFESDLPLERKIHARDAVNLIDRVADMAEDISDELSIYAIKRVL